MTKLCGVKLTLAERRLLEWLTSYHGMASCSDTLRHLLHQGGRLAGAPPALRAEASLEREQHPPRKVGTEMLDPDELQQQVIDISGKDSVK